MIPGVDRQVMGEQRLWSLGDHCVLRPLRMRPRVCNSADGHTPAKTVLHACTHVGERTLTFPIFFSLTYCFKFFIHYYGHAVWHAGF